MPKIRKVAAPSMPVNIPENAPKKRGRPKGSKNKVSTTSTPTIMPKVTKKLGRPSAADIEKRMFIYRSDSCGCTITTGMRVVDISCIHRNYMKLVKK